MNNEIQTNKIINKYYKKLKREAEASGYYLNPDEKFTKDLIKGLLINEKRYTYWACPCRLASGNKSKDLDIICPCYYRDEDILEYGTCYCALYVSQDVLNGKKDIDPIPERRTSKKEKKVVTKRTSSDFSNLNKPVWRCKICGYLCARDGPPEICPICKAKKERFERFI
jgi:ferredoxin-thioredoxin reductase catalytic subunit